MRTRCSGHCAGIGTLQQQHEQMPLLIQPVIFGHNDIYYALSQFNFVRQGDYLLYNRWICKLSSLAIRFEYILCIWICTPDFVHLNGCVCSTNKSDLQQVDRNCRNRKMYIKMQGSLYALLMTIFIFETEIFTLGQALFQQMA